MIAPLSPTVNRRTFLTAAAAAALGSSARAIAAEPRLRVAVIGHTGRGNYGHGLDTMWLKIPDVELVAVADADANGLAAEQKKLSLDKVFADYRQMLGEMKPDIVAIAPRHADEHRDMALAAIAAGARGIYIEKPFCRSPAEADEIIAAADAKGVKIAIAHRNRYDPVLPVIAQLLKDGAIGRVVELRGRGKEDARGGPLDLWVLGSHVLNLASCFAGAPLACTATILQKSRPATHADVHEGDEGVGPLVGDEVHARFETERGWPLFFDSGQNAGKREAGFGLQIIGTAGVIDFRCDKQPLAQLWKGNPTQPTAEPRAWVPISSAGIGQPEPNAELAAQMAAHLIPARDLLAAIRENRPPLCNPREAGATVEMICAVFESHRLEGRRVTLPLKTRQNPLGLL